MATEGAAIRRRLLPPSHPKVAEAESVLGGALSAAGRTVEAEPLLRRSHSVLAASRGPRARATRDAALRAARFYERADRSALAAEYRALSAVSKSTAR
jgi:hypothetical protein